MKPSSAKAKGRLFQQKVRDKILDKFPKLLPEDVRSTSMGAGGEDILLSPYARGEFNYSVECKKKASFAIYKDYDQAKANCPAGVVPLVAFEGNRREAMVCLSMDDFFSLLGEQEE